MTGNPVVTSSIEFSFNGVNFNLQLKDNITFISGASAQGKSYIRGQISQFRGFPFVVKTFWSGERWADFSKLLTETKNCLIIIDNADILLDDAKRALIAADTSNQYIILGRNSTNLRLGYPSYARVVYNEEARLFSLKYPMLGDRR